MDNLHPTEISVKLEAGVKVWNMQGKVREGRMHDALSTAVFRRCQGFLGYAVGLFMETRLWPLISTFSSLVQDQVVYAPLGSRLPTALALRLRKAATWAAPASTSVAYRKSFSSMAPISARNFARPRALAGVLMTVVLTGAR